LSKYFEMKDLGPAKQILDMSSRDRFEGILNLSREKYIEKLFSRFNLKMLKPVIHLRELT